MDAPRLYVSFWDIALANLPIGAFRHRLITPSRARTEIDAARKSNRLFCVSGPDLLGPSQTRERASHEQLCKVLSQESNIAFTLRDFCIEEETEDGREYFATPLEFAQVRASSRLLVVTCAYALPDKPARSKPLRLSIAADSVEFHLFESVRRKAKPEGRGRRSA